MTLPLPPRPLPLVGVTPTERLGGVSRLDAAAAQEAGGLFHVLPLDEALSMRWPTDAWVVPYKLVGFGDLRAGWPRFRQDALGNVRQQGGDILATMLILDFDLPKIPGPDGKPCKQRWTQELLDAFLAKFEQALDEGHDLVGEWTVFYTTNHGARLIYVLEEPLAVESYRPYMKGLISAFLTAGIPIAGATECMDWTHLFRLPFVVDGRYGEPTDPLVYEIRPENRLALARIVPLGPNDQVGTALDVKVDHDPRPSENEIQGLLTESFAQLAKKWLKGHACYEALFEHTKIAPVGRRDSTLASYVGDTINQLFPRTNVTKAHIYALFYEPVLTTLEPDRDTPDWHVKLWELTERFWAEQQAEAEQRAEAVAVHALTVEEKKYQILQGMKEWCNDPRLHSQVEAEALVFVSEHLICSLGEFNYVMTPNGRYDAVPVRDKQIPARVRELGMEDLIQLQAPDKDGRLKPVPQAKIIREHGTVAAGVQARLGDFGGWISDIETENACLNVKTFARRTDLQPEFNPCVDEWLRRIGGDEYEKFERWLGLALAFDQGAICALALIGRQGFGKKMLIQGLAEALTTCYFVDASEVFDSFNAGLLKSPFVLVDEAWPAGVQPADTFRRLTAGNTLTIKQKFRDNTSFVAPLRLILTANNEDIILDLAGKKDLTKRDQEALAIRLFPIDVDDSVTDWLREKGGHEFTSGWIRGDGGQRSQWILAKHFLFLYEKHKGKSDPRFLVEGAMTRELSIALRVHGAAIQPVIETLLVMCEGLEKGKAFKGCAIDNGKIYVTSTEVLQQFRGTVGRLTRVELNLRKIKASLGALNSRQTPVKALRSRPESGKQRWYELDVQLLHEVSQRDGKPVGLLERLVEGARVLQFPAELPPLPPIPKKVQA